MIDPHVHLRGWNENRKETIEHGLDVAYAAGLDAVFEMPNTSPSLTTYDLLQRRIEYTDRIISKKKLRLFHGIYAGLRAEPKQIEEIVNAYSSLFPRIVGLKLFAARSTGDLGIIDEYSQKLVYNTLSELGYNGVLAVHCEKESEFLPQFWNPAEPYSHALARPPKSEVESVRDQIKFADKVNFKGTLHICHISVPESLDAIEQARNSVGFRITCGITPQHCMLYDELMNKAGGNLLKINPPLRSDAMRKAMLAALLDGKIDWIESDHAPHTLDDKLKNLNSGIPVLPYFPHFIKYLKERGATEKQIDDLTNNNIIRTFGIEIENTFRRPDYNLAKEYPFDPFEILK
ncbi:dihydroorotase [Candidatus Woesearchaeota archaeon CG07_land_8_20_14_0_80_44_23]|nr:MAG: dihydroorotase [Candidatus Woesearchaeota archaeon CG07_land_8_20_14_0_80_44_23]